MPGARGRIAGAVPGWQRRFEAVMLPLQRCAPRRSPALLREAMSARCLIPMPLTRRRQRGFAPQCHGWPPFKGLSAVASPRAGVLVFIHALGKMVLSPPLLSRSAAGAADAASHSLAEEMYNSINSFLHSVLSAGFERGTMKSKYRKFVLLHCFWKHRSQRALKRIFRIKREHLFPPCCRCILLSYPGFHFPFVIIPIPVRSQRIRKKQRAPGGAPGLALTAPRAQVTVELSQILWCKEINPLDFYLYVSPWVGVCVLLVMSG